MYVLYQLNLIFTQVERSWTLLEKQGTINSYISFWVKNQNPSETPEKTRKKKDTSQMIIWRSVHPEVSLNQEGELD